MKFAKWILMGTGSLVLAGLILTLLVPKAAHAVAATLVQVANTSSNPAMVSSINDPGRVPFFAEVTLNSCTTSPCIHTFAPVPAGHRLVLQHVSGVVPFSFNALPTYMWVNVFSYGVGSVNFNVPIASSLGSGTTDVFDQPTLFYFDAGQTPQISFISDGTFAGAGRAFWLSLVGYELDCTAAPCSAMASQ